MSWFLERLRSYLEHVARAPEGVPVIQLDIAAHRRHYLETLDQLPVQRRKDDYLRGFGVGLSGFVELLGEEIHRRLMPDASSGELSRLIDIAIDRELGLERTTGSVSRDDELRLLVMSVQLDLSRQQPDQWESPSKYAFEIRATRRRGERYVISRAGAVLLDLPGIDAVRWALALEAAQTLGPRDDWRISPELAMQLLDEPRREISCSEVPRAWHFSLATIRRLDAMLLLHYDHYVKGEPRESWHPADHWSYSVFDRARPLLEEIAEQRPTPFAVLANALLRDEVAHALDAVHPDPEQGLREGAAEATALQARMVVHEIRNALIPAQIALSKLSRELGDAAQAGSIERHRTRLDNGIQRALSFAEEMLRVANLGLESPAPFDFGSAIRDAIAGVAGELNGSLRHTPPEKLPLVVGPRSRFVLAVRNLLRNAAQAVAGTEGIVEVSVEPREGEVALRIDDNGPGVPVEQRSLIFDPGVALRPGGSGQGLSLVRQVVEGEMHGSVSCGESPLGGARFEIVIPARRAQGT